LIAIIMVMLTPTPRAHGSAGTTAAPTQEVEMTDAPEAKVDADGWETVSHKKKRR
jgi:hypothetical protein